MLIEGIVIAAYAAQANKFRSSSSARVRGEADILRRRRARGRGAGYLGTDILAPACDLSMVVHRGAGAYICGEETGLLDALEGKRGNPRLKPPCSPEPGALPDALTRVGRSRPAGESLR